MDCKVDLVNCVIVRINNDFHIESNGDKNNNHTPIIKLTSLPMDAQDKIINVYNAFGAHKADNNRDVDFENAQHVEISSDMLLTKY